MEVSQGMVGRQVSLSGEEAVASAPRPERGCTARGASEGDSGQRVRAARTGREGGLAGPRLFPETCAWRSGASATSPTGARARPRGSASSSARGSASGGWRRLSRRTSSTERRRATSVGGQDAPGARDTLFVRNPLYIRLPPRSATRKGVEA